VSDFRSVSTQPDYALLELMLKFYAPGALNIVDATCNERRFWKGSGRRVVGIDLAESVKPDLCANNQRLPLPSGWAEVLVYDPPHLPIAAASANSSQIYASKFGITSDRPKADNIVFEFQPFLDEAYRVLQEGGLVFAKIADLVHNHRYQWQHIDFILEAQRQGFTPCDLIVSAKPGAGNLRSSKWQNLHHARKAHCYFIILRKGAKCE